MAAERVEKFDADCSNLLSSLASKGCKAVEPKLHTEVDRLTKWLQKHQEETLPDGHKTKLMSVVQRYTQFATTGVVSASNDADAGASGAVKLEPQQRTVQVVRELVECLLMLPEGKLVSGKSAKTQGLKWLDGLQAADKSEGGGAAAAELSKKMLLLDISCSSVGGAGGGGAKPKGKAKAVAKKGAAPDKVEAELTVMEGEEGDTRSLVATVGREELARAQAQLEEGSADLHILVGESSGKFVSFEWGGADDAYGTA
eukprot:gnl/TRDRNA2_/TRDRNA2_198954_c0_seq1.p1 gnl/TRDRNA2_/TRDRNA2_198954_c0~~gnl/TRDRNA2_/TRDRNA2_198954_c0_seq1.p1  ORF type:complete len:257 (+),score=83.70 gnl/TRDRNA2_/TRDRNA2_198954_c0_seq1:98-868(+)